MRMRWTYGVCHSLHTNGVGNGLGGDGRKIPRLYVVNALYVMFTPVDTGREYLNKL